MGSSLGRLFHSMNTEWFSSSCHSLLSWDHLTSFSHQYNMGMTKVWTYTNISTNCFTVHSSEISTVLLSCSLVRRFVGGRNLIIVWYIQAYAHTMKGNYMVLALVSGVDQKSVASCTKDPIAIQQHLLLIFYPLYNLALNDRPACLAVPATLQFKVLKLC